MAQDVPNRATALQDDPEAFSPALREAVATVESKGLDTRTALATVAIAVLSGRGPEISQDLSAADVVDVFARTDAVDAEIEPLVALTPVSGLGKMMGGLRFLHVLPMVCKDRDTFALALSGTSDVNALSRLGTLGHTIAQKGTLEHLSVALEAGLDPTMLGAQGETMETVARWQGRTEMAEALAAAGERWRQDRPELASSMPSREGNTDMFAVALARLAPLGMSEEQNKAFALCGAASEGRADLVDGWLARGADPTLPLPATALSPELVHTKTVTALHLLAANKSIDAGILGKICAHAGSVDVWTGDGSMTPLMMSAAGSVSTAARVFLEHKADPALKNEDGWNAVRFAREQGDEPTVGLFRAAIVDSQREHIRAIAAQRLQDGVPPPAVDTDRAAKNQRLKAAIAAAEDHVR